MAFSFLPYHGPRSIFLTQLIVLNVVIQMSFAQTCSIKTLDSLKSLAGTLQHADHSYRKTTCVFQNPENASMGRKVSFQPPRNVENSGSRQFILYPTFRKFPFCIRIPSLLLKRTRFGHQLIYLCSDEMLSYLYEKNRCLKKKSNYTTWARIL
jgi:hypothetical protein